MTNHTHGVVRRTFSRVNPKHLVGASGRSISLTSWLAVVVLTITVISLIVVSIVSLSHGTELSDNILEQRVRALRSLKASEIARYVNTTIAQTSALASSDTTVEATERFTQAYRELLTQDPGTAATDDVLSFYRYEFGPDLEAATGVTIAWRDLVPTGNASTYLQYAYVTANESGPSVGRLVDDAGDGSEWSAVHQEFHPTFLDITDRLGVDDLYIIDPDEGVVVYSTGKAPDFATSLGRGPYSASALATLTRAVREAPEAGAVMVADLAPYAPALGEPAGFFAAPILTDGRLIGVLVIRIPVDKVNEIMTSNGNWADEGLGATGETYLVGSDGRMRSISRIFLEDPAAYFAGVEAARSLSGSSVDTVRALGTTVVFQQAADPDMLEQASEGNRDVFETTNYVGHEVFASYEPVDVEEVNWFVVLEVDREEARASLIDFRQTILIVVSVFVLLVTFFTVAWARRALDPVRAISERLMRAIKGEPSTDMAPSREGPIDIDQLNDDVTRIIEMSDARRLEVSHAAGNRLETLRGLLPPAIIDRLDVGDRLVVEQIFQASVAVVSLEGLGALIRGSDAATSRSVLDQVVDLLDTMSAEHGLERVKVVGDLYYAGCGLSNPYLDHAPRALDFALEAEQGLSELSVKLSRPLSLAVGIHSGPVSVGLAGSSRLVYDVWGETLATSSLLARRARPGEILVSAETRKLLPPGTEVRAHNDGQEPRAWQVPLDAEAEKADHE